MGGKKEKRRFLDKFVRRSVARGTTLIFRVASPFLENFVSRHSQVRTHWKYLPEPERWNINTIFAVLVERNERMLGYRAERRRGQWRRWERGKARVAKPSFPPETEVLSTPTMVWRPASSHPSRLLARWRQRPIELNTFSRIDRSTISLLSISTLFARRASFESPWLLFNVRSKHFKLCRSVKNALNNRH